MVHEGRSGPAILTWIEKSYHRKRRQRRLGRLTPIEFVTINTGLKAAQQRSTPRVNEDPGQFDSGSLSMESIHQ